MSGSKETTLSGYFVRVMPHGEGEGKTLQITDRHRLAPSSGSETFNLPMSEELVRELLTDLALPNKDLIDKIKDEMGE